MDQRVFAPVPIYVSVDNSIINDVVEITILTKSAVADSDRLREAGPGASLRLIAAVEKVNAPNISSSVCCRSAIVGRRGVGVAGFALLAAFALFTLFAFASAARRITASNRGEGERGPTRYCQ